MCIYIYIYVLLYIYTHTYIYIYIERERDIEPGPERCQFLTSSLCENIQLVPNPEQGPIWVFVVTIYTCVASAAPPGAAGRRPGCRRPAWRCLGDSK